VENNTKLSENAIFFSSSFHFLNLCWVWFPVTTNATRRRRATPQKAHLSNSHTQKICFIFFSFSTQILFELSFAFCPCFRIKFVRITFQFYFYLLKWYCGLIISFFVPSSVSNIFSFLHISNYIFSLLFLSFHSVFINTFLHKFVKTLSFLHFLVILILFLFWLNSSCLLIGSAICTF